VLPANDEAAVESTPGSLTADGPGAEVTALLRSNPFAFPHKPPLYVRALLYDYRYSSREEKEATGAWWVW
jgi:lipase maturation factor